MNIRLFLPVPPGTPVTQTFGENPQVYARWGYAGHNGIDYGAPHKTHITAAADGLVSKLAYEAGGYGNYIVLDHGGYLTYYAHLNRALVHVGKKVSAGEVIAESDNTGFSTGPHLHFALKIPILDNPGYKNYHNPWPYFAAVGADEVQPPAIPETALDGQLVVTAPRGLYVRSAPRADAPPLGIIPLGTRLTPQVIGDQWVEVAAYVHRDWVANAP